MFQPETESTQVRVLSTKALTCREHKNRHHDKLLLRRRRGKSPACLATGRCVLGCPSSLKTDQTTFWLTYVQIYQSTRSRVSQPHSSSSSSSSREALAKASAPREKDLQILLMTRWRADAWSDSGRSGCSVCRKKTFSSLEPLSLITFIKIALLIILF